MKIRGAQGLVYLPHAVLVFGPELCPTGVETCHLRSISIFECENQSKLSFHACKYNLEKESKTSQHLGVTEWRAGRDARRQPWNSPYEICSCCPSVPSTLPNGHPSANIFPGRGWWGVWKGGMTLQALGGWNRLAVGTASEGSPPLLEVEITHTHTVL